MGAREVGPVAHPPARQVGRPVLDGVAENGADRAVQPGDLGVVEPASQPLRVQAGRDQRLVGVDVAEPDQVGLVEQERLDGELGVPSQPLGQVGIVEAGVERLDAELELGRHAELVPELEQLVAQEPLRERLRWQLMLALYRAGRQADALAAYADARRTLVEELALEPGPALKELERAILAQDPALDLTADAERTTPAVPEPAVHVSPERHNKGRLIAIGLFAILIATAAWYVFSQVKSTVPTTTPTAPVK